MKKLIAFFLLVIMFSSCIVVPRNFGMRTRLHHRYERHYAPMYRKEPIGRW